MVEKTLFTMPSNSRKTWNGALFRVTTRSTFWGYRKKSHPRNTCMLTIARYTYKISLPNWKQKKIKNVVVLSPFFALDTFDPKLAFPPPSPGLAIQMYKRLPKKNPAAHPKFPEGRPSTSCRSGYGPGHRRTASSCRSRGCCRRGRRGCCSSGSGCRRSSRCCPWSRRSR